MKFVRERHGALRREGKLYLVPLIDVVMFLLLYFMFATTLTPPEGQLATALRAEGRGGAAGRELVPQVVRVERVEGRGAFVVGERVIRDRARLTEVLRALPKEGGVVVRVSGVVTVEDAAAAVQAAKDAGFTRVSYVPGA